ncbi:hypothetical protein BSAF29S_01506 [Bacillus safensis subsp. safensis]
MLKLENVSKTYKGGKKAVKNIDLEIAKGEFICFIGPSGCGKTTHEIHCRKNLRNCKKR